MERAEQIMINAKQYETDMIRWRRKIHIHPEVGFELPGTQRLVKEELERMGLEVQSDFVKSAVLGTLDTGKPGKVIAVRADMDGLAIKEESGEPFCSEVENVAHACGHDAHTAICLGLAKYLSEHKKDIPGGKIKFIFQPAEEGPAPGGAKLIMESGVLDDVDAVIGAHSQPLYLAGQIGCKYGDAFASGDFFEVNLKGSGSHAASPHLGKDVIVTAAEMISAIQNIRSRELPPLKNAVISVCSINAGQLPVKNVLPAECTFGGTFRAYDDELREYIAKRIGEIVEIIAKMNGIEAEYTDSFNYPYFRNDDDVIDIVYHAAKEMLGAENVIKKETPEMGSEDFAWYTKKIKAAFFFFGIRNEEKGCIYSLHNPKFRIDEDAFVPTLSVFVNAIYCLMEDERINGKS
mgnify:CR=1 FL=1